MGLDLERSLMEHYHGKLKIVLSLGLKDIKQLIFIMCFQVGLVIQGKNTKEQEEMLICQLHQKE